MCVQNITIEIAREQKSCVQQQHFKWCHQIWALWRKFPFFVTTEVWYLHCMLIKFTFWLRLYAFSYIFFSISNLFETIVTVGNPCATKSKLVLHDITPGKNQQNEKELRSLKKTKMLITKNSAKYSRKREIKTCRKRCIKVYMRIQVVFMPIIHKTTTSSVHKFCQNMPKSFADLNK